MRHYNKMKIKSTNNTIINKLSQKNKLLYMYYKYF
jgi:hypothetical protein